MVTIDTLVVKLHVLISQKNLYVIFEFYSPKTIEKHTSIVQNGWMVAENGVLSQVDNGRNKR
jgi:trehalose-6-phosphatase